MKIIFYSLLFISIVNNVIYMTSINENENGPKETQRAQCTVTAGDVQASAEAIVSKSLDGVCGSDDMKAAFENLEKKLLQELEVIKGIVKNLLSDNSVKSQMSTISDTNHQLKPISSDSKHIYASKYEKYSSKRVETDSTVVGQNLATKSLETRHLPGINKSTREAEIKKLNNTMLSGTETKLFAYYWKLDRFVDKLKLNVSIDYSPAFAILGKRFRIKAFLNHLNRDLVYLQLEENISSRTDEFKSVFLETGNIFKPLQSKLHFKHKIAVLHQDTTSKLDLESQEFTNIDNGFLIPISALLTNAFLKNDTILVKLILYL